MGLLFASGTRSGTPQGKSGVSDELLHRLECKACSLNKANLRSPKMLPTGHKQPLIYLLGDNPTQIEDREGEQFISNPMQLLWKQIPKRLYKYVRTNNVIRCFPGRNKDGDSNKPERLQVECCRPSIIADIEATKPVAIIGLGDIPLSWFKRPSGIQLWRGRRTPVKVGNHNCWYYSVEHPKDILENKKNGWGKSDREIAFEFDIKRIISEIEGELPEPVVHTAKFARENITCIYGTKESDLADLEDFLEYAGNQEITGFDYETQNLRPYKSTSKILTAAVSCEDETVAFAIDHPEAGWTQKQKVRVKQALLKFLKTKAIKAVHNMSFECEWTCFFFGWEYARSVPWQDTQTQAYVLDERVGDSKPGAIALEFISLQHFGINIKDLTKGLDKKNMEKEPLRSLLPYNGIDAKYHRLNYIVMKQRIIDDKVEDVYEEKLRQVPTAVLAQLKGLPVDAKINADLAKEYEGKIAEALANVLGQPEAKQFRKLTGQEFNPGSSQDVIVLLRDILKTRTGQPGSGWSTTKDVLKLIGVPICDGVIAYREATKLKSTYVDPYGPENTYNGYVHPNFGTTFTETGRWNSEDPNVQNVPTRNKEAKKVRRQIKKPVIASFDYGQIDARIIACGSRDRAYCKALWENYDIHMEWARKLAPVVPQWVGGKEFIRDEAKLKDFRSGKVKNQWVFALFYGAALRTTAGRFEVEEKVLQASYEEFWDQFKDVKTWQQTIIDDFDETGYVQLLGGQRRRAPLSRGQLINSPVQNGTNRIVLNGMNRLSETGNFLLQAPLQIHDDLTFWFDSEREFEDSVETIISTMLDGRDFPWFIVPLVIEMKYGSSWADLQTLDKEHEVFSSVDWHRWPKREKIFM